MQTVTIVFRFSDNTIKNRWHLIIRRMNADAISLDSVGKLSKAHSEGFSLPDSVTSNVATTTSNTTAKAPAAATHATASAAVDKTSVTSKPATRPSPSIGKYSSRKDEDGHRVETSSTLIIDCSTLNCCPTDNSLVSGGEYIYTTYTL
jgi:hypothetical protein